uniref:exodeoxyribonuclease III n=1 Tax=Pygocentrus nattereri TaxID=42514 RepID=A0AAR2KHB0_PYGNA
GSLGVYLKGTSKVFAHLKSLAADIVFLQETHIKPTRANLLKCRWVNQIFQSTFSSKARGVAILISKSIPFRHVSTICDPNGRFLLVTGHIYTHHVTLLNIYGPNFDNPNFFSKVFDLLPNLSDTNVIVGGDFNCVIDNYLDRSSQPTQLPSAASATVNNLMLSTHLVDIWRLQHPTDRDYSFFSQRHKSYSRIDYFLLDSNLISNVISTKYHNILISDHSPTSLVLD